MSNSESSPETKVGNVTLQMFDFIIVIFLKHQKRRLSSVPKDD